MEEKEECMIEMKSQRLYVDILGFGEEMMK